MKGLGQNLAQSGFEVTLHNTHRTAQHMVSAPQMQACR